MITDPSQPDPSVEVGEFSLPKVYIAGPMSGIEDFNRPAFRSAARILRDAGCDVVCPADFPQSGEWEDLMKHAIPQMLSCDRVVLLGQWEKSRGARLEVFIARELGMHVETLTETLEGIAVAQVFQQNGNS